MNKHAFDNMAIIFALLFQLHFIFLSCFRVTYCLFDMYAVIYFYNVFEIYHL